jgi:hypothetical protein
LIITVPNICSLRNRFRAVRGLFPFHYASTLEGVWGDHIRIFTKDSLEALLAEEGFRIRSVTSNGWWGTGFGGHFIPSFGDILIFYAIIQ